MILLTDFMRTEKDILLERYKFINLFKPERDKIPVHVTEFVKNLVSEVKSKGYVIWRENLYDPPVELSFTDREHYYFAYRYAELVNGLTISHLSKMRNIRSEHQHYRPTVNVFIMDSRSISIEEINEMWPK